MTERGPSHAEPLRSASAIEIPPSRGGLDRLNQPAPEWGSMPWVGSEPLTLDELRGRVVFIRFWTDTCPYCRATAPSLATLDAEYRSQGVTVIGMYHPKPRGADRSVEQVSEVVDSFGWRFPVALDLDWAVLDAYWLDHGPREFTSVSMVLDREGIVRYVHPGPEFHPDGPPSHEQCRADYRQIRRVLDRLLAEPKRD